MVASAPDVLESLLGPLSFASRHDFAGVARLKGFEALVRARVEAARGASAADEALLSALEARVAGFEDLDAAAREGVVREVVRLLAPHVSLPEDLLPLVGGREGRPTPGPSPGPSQSPGQSPGPSPHPAPDPDAGEGQTPIRWAPSGPPSARSTGALHGADPLLDRPITSLSGVGPSRAEAFRAKGVETLRDLLWFLPISWERRVRAARIADLAPDTKAVVVGTVESASERPARRRRVFEAVVGDGTGRVRVTFFRSVSWAARRLAVGARVGLSGPVKKGYRGGLEMAHPELLDPTILDDEGDPDEVLPRYSEVENVHPRALRGLVAKVLGHAERLPDPLPPELTRRRGLLPPGEAVSALHAPPPGTSLEALAEGGTEAQRRLIYEEFFFLQLGLALKARGVKVEPGIAFGLDEGAVEAAIALLPFAPTGAQARVVREIAADMARSEPMNRLLQGDVGSGKTAVAAVALTLAFRAGWQGAVMAPTELLAEQHARTLARLLEPAGVRVVLLTGSLGAAARRGALAAIASGEAGVVVGTHALIQEGVDFARLGLVVVDEQHRFGVRQRMEIMQKGVRPDVLVMTATPIPRTLAMTAYGDLDLSVIDEMPPGRTPITTKIYRARDVERVHERVRKEVEKGHQAYVVYPLIESSEALEDVKAATEMHAHLGREVFPDLRLGLLHGRMAPAEKEQVMRAFVAGELDVLVATTVIEVGIDVPNASVMVIEHAERFGLSQLHQLRGRVGRGAARSYCLLVAEEARGERVRERLKVMEATTDGFRIAEEDLRIRGPGELLGTRQSGHPDLLFGNLARDRTLLAQARSDAAAVVDDDPLLAAPEHRMTAAEVLARWGGRLSLGRVG